MLSDEEKKAIERAEFLIKIDTYLEKEMLTNLLNLIEKQSKEIERINEILIWKQKHEEQLQKEIEELKSVEDGITYRYEWSEIPKKINELVKAVNEIRKENK